MNNSIALSMCLATVFVTGCTDSGSSPASSGAEEQEEAVADSTASGEAAPPPLLSCDDRGATYATATVLVEQDYYAFEQSKSPSYFTQNSPAKIDEDFALSYCPSHKAPADWYTGPVSNWQQPNGKAVFRYYRDVSCQVRSSSSPGGRPVASAQNGQTILYQGCRFDMPAPTKTQSPAGNQKVCPSNDPNC
ncbi:hypothetical protein [Parerythrobacter aestuarii]|uniref:hypothetical protein n=1 Tax=Parerythrobacter aestuarii TaxID=3020909 RepID=UPI0024DE08AE|nr:hypothetical protein [Parerythrobacter aestuarii]